MPKRGPSASEIRRSLYNGRKDWREMVGDEVEEVIEEVTPLRRRIGSREMTHLDKKFY